MFGLGLGLGFTPEENQITESGPGPGVANLLQEDGFAILLEDGSFLLLET
jgi:hypothetical protein